MGTLHEDQYTFFIISPQVFLEGETFQTNRVQKIKAHILRGFFFFYIENRAVAGLLHAVYLRQQTHTQNM